MDILSEFITLLKPVTNTSSILSLRGDWSVKYTSQDFIKFGMVLKGSAWVKLQGVKKPVYFTEGDVWLLIRPGEVRMGSDLNKDPIGFEEIYNKAKGKAISFGDKRHPESAIIFGGRIDFDPLVANLLIDKLPALVHLKKEHVSSSLKGIFGLFYQEALAPRMGSELLFNSYILLILIETLRSIDPQHLRIGSLRGMTHPQLNQVIKIIHENYQKNWTVAEMAQLYGASRSGFAAHFKSIVGVSPADYLLKWRMVKASEFLRESDKLVSEIAYAVGYESETAFSTAFLRVVGSSPSQYRKGIAPNSTLRLN